MRQALLMAVMAGVFVAAACCPAADELTPVLSVASGFAVEAVYVVPRDRQGSWVSLSADRHGRLYASDQYGPLYRISVGPQKQVQADALNLPIGGVHGMCWVGDDLYAVVGQREACEPGLYRLRDRDGDGSLDDVERLCALGGDGEHGPHGVVPAPDGRGLFVVGGNAAPLPQLTASRVPMNWRDDSLLPPLPALIGSETRGLSHGGWICRTDLEGRQWELICMGLRNAYSIAVDRAGELFTFDSDTEFEIGLPWYRPTRVLHGVSGADFGWRRGALKVPERAPNTVPSLLQMGLGSPTAVLFGTGAAFPARYRESLFVADWCFGRLCAVHLVSEGAGFRAYSEPIVTGTPLPITAACINPHDGAFYFVIGGRKTQSVLYRLSWQGTETEAKTPPSAISEAVRQRRELEALHGRAVDGTVDACWPSLGSDDCMIRHAARIALEWQPVALWQERALAERNPMTALTALLALVRCGEQSLQPRILAALETIDWSRLGSLRGDWLRVSSLAFSRMGSPPDEVRERWRTLLLPGFPSDDRTLDASLCELLVYLRSPEIVPKAMTQLSDSNTRERQLEFARLLSNSEVGWTPTLRGEYFDWLGRTTAWRGGASFRAFLDRFRDDALARAAAEEQDGLRRRLEAARSAASLPAAALTSKRPFVKAWTLDELVSLAAEAEKRGDPERGRQWFAVAGCAACHSFAGGGGAIGSDLTAVIRRMSLPDLLEAIVDPSKEISDQYGAVVVAKHDGSHVSGRIINFNGGAVHLLQDLFDPSAVTRIPERDIESITRSRVSLMPAGMLNSRSADEILDLLAFLKSGLHEP